MGGGERGREDKRKSKWQSIQDGNPIPGILKNGVPFILLNPLGKKYFATMKAKCVISFSLGAYLKQNVWIDLWKESVSLASKVHLGEHAGLQAASTIKIKCWLIFFLILKINFAVESIWKQVGHQDEASFIKHSDFTV